MIRKEKLHLLGGDQAVAREVGQELEARTLDAGTGRRNREAILSAALVGALIVIPLLSRNAYYIEAAIRVFIYVGVAVSYQLVFGYARLVSFGHAAFFGVAAYVTGTLTAALALPHVIAWLLSLVTVAILAGLVASIVIRLEPLLLAVATLAIALILVAVVSALGITGGQDGLITNPHTIPGIDVGVYNYIFAAASMVLIVLLTMLAVTSPFGRWLLAVGDDPVAARSVGANPNRMLVVTFVLGAVLAGVAGIALAQTSAVLAPEAIGLDQSILLLTMIALGGLRSIPGAIIGAVILSIIPILFAPLQQVAVLLYGGIILIVFLLLPNGLISLLRPREPRVSKVAR